MLQQSQSLTRLQRNRPFQLASPQKEIQRQRYPDSADFKNSISQITLPQIKKLSKIEQTVQIYKRQPKLPQIQSQFAASEQQLQRRKPTQEQVLRKSITPEKRIRRNQIIFAMKTKAGCQPNKATKINQDAAIVCPKNLENIGYRLFAVCDGHGLFGHLVSNYIKQTLPKHMFRLLKDTDQIEHQIAKSFQITNREIWNSEVDTNLSGSTTVAVLLTKDKVKFVILKKQKIKKVITANVGDSRAIMCRYDNGWKVVELTRDHKPDDPIEKQRILNYGGRVECQKDFHGNPIGPMRVWLSYIQAPGLAMTRSMGDKVGAQAGVIADPEILEFPVTEHDQFIIVASDGVWEYLTNEEVMSFVIPYLEKDSPDTAAERIVQESILSWRRNSLARDDITCVVVFLQQFN